MIFRVTHRLRPSGEWRLWTNYAQYDEAELAAQGLITGGAALECQIWEVGKGEPKIVAYISSMKKPGWPHGAAAVRKVN